MKIKKGDTVKIDGCAREWLVKNIRNGQAYVSPFDIFSLGLVNDDVVNRAPVALLRLVGAVR